MAVNYRGICFITLAPDCSICNNCFTTFIQEQQPTNNQNKVITKQPIEKASTDLKLSFSYFSLYIFLRLKNI
jgi:hypothetical protein